MLVAVVDRSGRGGTGKVTEAFEDVKRGYSDHGLALRWPVSAEIVSIAIMGATKSHSGSHTLFVSSRAVQSDVLDGLIAHEMGHMLLTEARHPSHDPELLRDVSRAVRMPRAAGDSFAQAFNHVQDIYADDLAFLVFASNGDGRAYQFFSSWVHGNVASRANERWPNVGLAASNGFAIGNLVRHVLLSPEDPLWTQAREFDRDAGFEAVDSLAAFYARLPKDPSTEAFLHEVESLAGLLKEAATAVQDNV